MAGRHDEAHVGCTWIDAHTNTRIAKMSAAHTDCLFTRGTVYDVRSSNASTRYTPLSCMWSILISCRQLACPVYFIWHFGCLLMRYRLLFINHDFPKKHTASLFLCEIKTPTGSGRCKNIRCMHDAVMGIYLVVVVTAVRYVNYLC